MRRGRWNVRGRHHDAYPSFLPWRLEEHRRDRLITAQPTLRIHGRDSRDRAGLDVCPCQHQLLSPRWYVRWARLPRRRAGRSPGLLARKGTVAVERLLNGRVRAVRAHRSPLRGRSPCFSPLPRHPVVAGVAVHSSRGQVPLPGRSRSLQSDRRRARATAPSCTRARGRRRASSLELSDRRVALSGWPSSPAESRRLVTSQRHEAIDFREAGGVYSGVGTMGRRWRITRAVTGWRLDFMDPGDTAPTNAGLHASVSAAQTEANTPPSTTGRRRTQRPRDLRPGH